MGEYMQIFSRSMKISTLLSSALHFEAGIESGSFFNFLFLHDFVLVPKQTFLAVKLNEDVIGDFVKGLINGTGVLSLIPSLPKCDLEHSQKVSELIVRLGQAIQNFTEDMDFGKIVTTVQQIVNEFTVEAQSLCGDAVKEAQVAYVKINAHISKSDWQNRAIMHVVTEFNEVIRRVTKISQMIGSAPSLDLGNEHGQLLTFLAFWDFKA